MYKMINKPSKTSLDINECYEGESLEKKIRRIVHNNEPITDGAPRIYTERKDGVKPEYDIRTDRFELAVEATDYITKTKITERKGRLEAIKGGGKDSQAGGSEPIQATE
jgi:hypothetical protein